MGRDGLTVGFLNRFGKSLFLEPFGVGFQDRIRILMYLLSCMYPVCILIFQSVSHQDTSRLELFNVLNFRAV